MRTAAVGSNFEWIEQLQQPYARAARPRPRSREAPGVWRVYRRFCTRHTLTNLKRSRTRESGAEVTAFSKRSREAGCLRNRGAPGAQRVHRRFWAGASKTNELD
jgi:hypothetical protein